MHKKGADKIISVYWFAILTLVAGGIFAVVYSFYSFPYDVRNIEADLMTGKVADCLSENGRISSDIFSGEVVADYETVERDACTSQEDCQKVIGDKIYNIVEGIKNNLGIENIDEVVEGEGVAANFNCLVLQIAEHESTLQHCENFRDGNNNPLYCDGNSDEVKSLSNERETSLGVMQVNTKVHNINPENFEAGIIYAVENVLIKGYNSYKGGRVFSETGVEYKGWKAALRTYNGWGTGGDDDYVENVISQKGFIESIFPQCLSGIKEALINLQEQCEFDFSENNGDEYYLEVNFYDFDSDVLIARASEGNANLKAFCEIQDEKKYGTLAKCSEKSFYALDENGKQYTIKVLSVVRKTEKNVA
ncbi:MAG: hypothetical protein ABIH49_01455 [archaeon]